MLDFLQGLTDSAKGMFVSDDGSIKKMPILLMVGGAAIGGLLLPSVFGIAVGSEIIAAIVGAGAGLLAAGLAEKVLPASESAPAAPAPAGAAPAPARGPGRGADVPPPGSTPPGVRPPAERPR